MFEWLTESERYVNGKYVVGFNEETKKLILEDEETEERSEIDLFNSGIAQNIDYFEDWQKKLYTELIRTHGRIVIHVLSTNTGDSYFLEIYRNKTLLQTHQYSEQIVIVNYAIVCNGEVKGDILSYQEKKYAGVGLSEEKMFSEWIEKQIEEVPQFNNTDYWNTFNAIVFTEYLVGESEYNLLHEMFNESNG